jgi:hypothetical protein
MLELPYPQDFERYIEILLKSLFSLITGWAFLFWLKKHST